MCRKKFSDVSVWTLSYINTVLSQSANLQMLYYKYIYIKQFGGWLSNLGQAKVREYFDANSEFYLF